MKKYFFGWGNTKDVFKDIYATLSNDPSKLSGKRLTMFVANNSVVALTWFFVIYMVLRCQLTAVDFGIAILPLTVMGGYNLAMNIKAKNDDKTAKQTDKVIEEKIEDKSKPTP